MSTDLIGNTHEDDIFIMKFSMIWDGVRLANATITGIKDSFPFTMRGRINKGSIFENKNLKSHFIFHVSKNREPSQRLGLIFLETLVNVARVIFPLDNCKMT